MRALRIIPVLFVCLLLTGGHYGMLQCVAWTGMLWSYTEEGGLVQAAQDTFSGEKPCCLCEAIAESKQEESESPEPLQSKGAEKFKELKPLQEFVLKLPVARDMMYPVYMDPAHLLGFGRERPSSPPPRLWS